jgi:hypothetical protein
MYACIYLFNINIIVDLMFIGPCLIVITEE